MKRSRQSNKRTHFVVAICTRGPAGSLPFAIRLAPVRTRDEIIRGLVIAECTSDERNVR
jgi:hypothetical protein